jgi:hypothetical protein
MLLRWKRPSPSRHLKKIWSETHVAVIKRRKSMSAMAADFAESGQGGWRDRR